MERKKPSSQKTKSRPRQTVSPTVQTVASHNSGFQLLSNNIIYLNGNDVYLTAADATTSASARTFTELINNYSLSLIALVASVIFTRAPVNLNEQNLIQQNAPTETTLIQELHPGSEVPSVPDEEGPDECAEQTL